MIYNIHPIFVHFPIAFLTLYSILKILPVKRWLPSVPLRTVEQSLLLFGVLGAFAALSTGELAEEAVRPGNSIVEMHSFFASAATWMYGLLLAGEVLYFLNKKIIPSLAISVLTKAGLTFEKLLTNAFFSTVLAIVGLITITVTGLLGGVMVYGLTADPLAPIVLKILGLSI